MQSLRLELFRTLYSNMTLCTSPVSAQSIGKIYNDKVFIDKFCNLFMCLIMLSVLIGLMNSAEQSSIYKYACCFGHSGPAVDGLDS